MHGYHFVKCMGDKFFTRRKVLYVYVLRAATTYIGRVWDSVCGAFPQKTQKNPAKRFASNALIPAACEGETRDLNWAAKNRRSELAAALRLFRSRLSPTQSQTGP